MRSAPGRLRTSPEEEHRPGELAPGDALTDGLTVVERISRGRELEVYSVWSAERDCLCIAKALRPDRAGDRAARARLEFEARLLVAAGHPHLVRGYELVEVLPAPVLLMETLTGATLSQVIGDHGSPGLGTEDVVLLARQLVSVLGYLHRRGVVHLDLKPSNIVVQGGRAVLLDLSLARAPGRCSPGCGTPEYLAPEQAVGGPVDAATDVWGLGGVLYRALTGRRPFGTEVDPDDPRVVDPAPLAARAPDARLRHLVAACLSPEPQDRPRLADVRDQLDVLAADSGAAASA